VLRNLKNERCHYQRIMILTLNWMKIADLEKNVSQLIYRQILEINRINKNCILLREIVSRDETQCKDIRLKNCWVLNWLSSWVFIPTFWLAWVLNINVVTRLKYSISISWLDSISISSRVRTRWLDLTRQAIEYDVKRAKYRNFSGFSPLHYLFALSFW